MFRASKIYPFRLIPLHFLSCERDLRSRRQAPLGLRIAMHMWSVWDIWEFNPLAYKRLVPLTLAISTN